MKNSNVFSIREALGFGWSKVTANLGFFVLLAIISVVAPSLPSVIEYVLKQMRIELSFFSLGFTIISWIISMVVSVGVIKIALKVVDGEEYKLEDLYNTNNLSGNYILGSLLYGVVTFIGFLLLIVPGFIWSIKYMYTPYLIIDKGLKPREAFTKSGQVTQGQKINLWFFGIVLGLLNIAGAMVLLIGLFVTIPMTWVASAYVYRQFSKNLT